MSMSTVNGNGNIFMGRKVHKLCNNSVSNADDI